MAIRSSAMARAVRKTFSDTGTLSPRMERMPTAKAMSVAVGIPQPEEAAVPWLTAVNMRAGAMTPPKAAMTGIKAFLRLESSPFFISRRISSPTVKKNRVIRMSLMKLSTVIPRGNMMSLPSGALKKRENWVSRRLW